LENLYFVVFFVGTPAILLLVCAVLYSALFIPQEKLARWGCLSMNIGCIDRKDIVVMSFDELSQLRKYVRFFLLRIFLFSVVSSAVFLGLMQVFSGFHSFLSAVYAVFSLGFFFVQLWKLSNSVRPLKKVSGYPN